MKTHIYKLVLSCCFIIGLSGCKSEPTLQTYFVDHQETPNFTSVDIPLSILKLDESKFNEEQKSAYKSIKRLNFLGFKKDNETPEKYELEIEKINRILNNKAYNELMVVNNRGGKFTLKYMGDNDESIDELIVFGSSKDMGFGVLRVLGDDMNPNKIVALAKSLEHQHIDESQLKNVLGFFHQ